MNKKLIERFFFSSRGEKTFHPLPFWHLIGCVRVLAVLIPKLRRKDEAKCEGASIGIKRKVFWANFNIVSIYRSGRVKNLAREALNEVVAVKEKNCRTAWFMQESCSYEADQNCLSCQRPQKTVGGEITNKSGQVSINKNFNAWTYYFSNIPEVSWLTCFDVTF